MEKKSRITSRSLNTDIQPINQSIQRLHHGETFAWILPDKINTDTFAVPTRFSQLDRIILPIIFQNRDSQLFAPLFYRTLFHRLFSQSLEFRAFSVRDIFEIPKVRSIKFGVSNKRAKKNPSIFY